MRYLGGKSRLAKKFAPILQAELDRTGGVLWEPFVGGFNIVPALPDMRRNAVCSDAHPGLITLYSAMVGGWVPPESLSEERYAELRAERDWSNPLTAFAAFGCSFGGKEWGGYARSTKPDGSVSNYPSVSHRSLLRKVPHMRLCKFLWADYRSLSPEPGDVVYCDPPYANTTKYRGDAFDHEAFFAWCEQIASRGCAVFVSEFAIPDGREWEPVWSTTRKVAVSGTKPTKIATDYLLRVRS